MFQYDPIIGIWVKAQPKHLQTFIENWEKTNEVQAFCVYDLPPMLPQGSLVFLHAIGSNRLVAYAKYVECDSIKGWYEHILFAHSNLWINERERVWNTFGPNRLHTHNKAEFDKFWKEQQGIRGLFLMEDIRRISKKISWVDSMRILGVFRPLGFSYKYLTSTQVREFFKLAEIDIEIKIEGINSPKVISRIK
ncbi:MAG: hypothetical protein QXV01_06100 [Candidatus Bathyarchaeia archaeon]